MNRLEQDAADALQAYEDRRKAWGERAKVDLARFNQPAPTKVWAPKLNEISRKELDQLINTGVLPF